MARGDDNAATKAEHMAAPTSNAVAQRTLANGEPSTQGAKPTFKRAQISLGWERALWLYGSKAGTNAEQTGPSMCLSYATEYPSTDGNGCRNTA